MTDRNTQEPVRSIPSIFNDAIGPVMRGPSSSHCAAALRIGRLARDLMGSDIREVLVEFDTQGALATTHESQGSDMGLCGGLLGWEATDERLVASIQAIREARIGLEIRIGDLGFSHPNTYRLTLSNASHTHQINALSTGGGAIKVVEIDGIPVSMRGDCYEILLYTRTDSEPLAQALKNRSDLDDVLIHQGSGVYLVEARAQRPLAPDALAQMRSTPDVLEIRTLAPVLPVLWGKDRQVPFLICTQMTAYNADKDLELWELAVEYERARGNLTADQVLEKMCDVVQIMEQSVQEGIKGTEYADRILSPQACTFQAHMHAGKLFDGGILNQMILYVTALMETKSSMGVIVAAPTAGSCGALPGACLGAAHAMGCSMEETARAMLAAGLIGVMIAARATFAAEVAGCQAECGAGSAMAAAALVTLARGTVEQAVGAASMALQNVLGLICDPVANRVEVPCLGRNVMSASNALACANMALAGFDAVVPLDEVIETMLRVGKSLPAALRCTALGGLSTTPTSQRIEQGLEATS